MLCRKDLAVVIAARPNLPVALPRGILAMVRAERVRAEGVLQCKYVFLLIRKKPSRNAPGDHFGSCRRSMSSRLTNFRDLRDATSHREIARNWIVCG